MEELATTDVVLDPQSRMGIWIGEDVSKSFHHSASRLHLNNRYDFHDYSNIIGDRTIILFTGHAGERLLFSLGAKRLALYHIANSAVKVIEEPARLLTFIATRSLCAIRLRRI